MSVQPTSVIKLCKNVGLTNGNTLYFSAPNLQNNYFASKVKHSLFNNTYVRHNKNSIRVNLPAEQVTDCDYLYFQNMAYGLKFFYAFITSFNYINDNCTEITYQLDVWQTYMFDVTLKPCFIERQHSVVDTIGSNLVDEGLNVGEYLSGGFLDVITDKSKVAIIQTTLDLVQYKNDGSIQAPPSDTFGSKAGIFDGTGLYLIKITDSTGAPVDGLNSVMHALIQDGLSDRIINMWEYPASVFGELENNTMYVVNSLNAPISAQINLGLSRPTTSLGTYIPKNKKLFTFPFCCLYITNNCGNSIVLNWDFFNNPNNVTFTLYGTTTGEAKVRLCPNSYKNIGSGNFDEAIDSAPYPTISWVNDSYAIWLTQNRNTISQNIENMRMSAGLGIFGGALQAGTGVMMGQAGMIKDTQATSQLTGGIGSMFSTALNTKIAVDNLVATIEDAKIKPDSASAIQGTGLLIQNNRDGFRAIVKVPTPYNAKIIDDYFTKYGYAQKSIATPNIHARSRFTYVKTAGAQIVGGAPQTAINEMCALLDNGLTFWADTANLYNYSLNNATLI